MRQGTFLQESNFSAVCLLRSQYSASVQSHASTSVSHVKNSGQTLAAIPLSGHREILHTLIAMGSAAHREILHTLIAMGSAALAASVP